MKLSTFQNKMNSIRKNASTAYQNVAMSKPVGKVLDSKVGKAGVKVGDAVIKGVKAPGKILKEKATIQKEFRNKNSTYEKFKQNSK